MVPTLAKLNRKGDDTRSILITDSSCDTEKLVHIYVLVQISSSF